MRGSWLVTRQSGLVIDMRAIIERAFVGTLASVLRPPLLLQLLFIVAWPPYEGATELQISFAPPSHRRERLGIEGYLLLDWNVPTRWLTLLSSARTWRRAIISRQLASGQNRLKVALTDAFEASFGQANQRLTAAKALCESPLRQAGPTSRLQKALGQSRTAIAERDPRIIRDKRTSKASQVLFASN